ELEVGIDPRLLVMKPVHIIGVPLDLGGARRGVDMGPSAVRIAGLGDHITALGGAVTDLGNLAAPIPDTQHAVDHTKSYSHEIARVCQQLYDVATRALQAGALPVVLGGDHSLAAGSVAASAHFIPPTSRPPPGLIW